MILKLDSEPLPLATDVDGVVRVSGTRVTLDTIVTALQQGAAPEEIAQEYPSVPLADIYVVIGYYLRRRTDVDAYLTERARQAAEIRKEIDARFNPIGIRERLMARRSRQE